MTTPPSEPDARAFDTVAAAYRAHRVDYPASLIDWLGEGVPADGCVVDLGCGPGTLTRPLARRFRAVVAVDRSPAMLAHIEGPRVASQGERLPLVDGSCDLVVASQSLHWMERDAVLPEVQRVLRAGGVFAMCWQSWMAPDSVPEAIHRDGWVQVVGGVPQRDPNRPTMDGAGPSAAGDAWSGDVTVQWSPEQLAGFFASRSSAAAVDAETRGRLIRRWVELARERCGDQVAYRFGVGARRYPAAVCIP